MDLTRYAPYIAIAGFLLLLVWTGIVFGPVAVLLPLGGGLVLVGVEGIE